MRNKYLLSRTITLVSKEKEKVGEGRVVSSCYSALQPLLQFLKSVSFHLSDTSYLFYFSFLKKIHVKSYSSSLVILLSTHILQIVFLTNFSLSLLWFKIYHHISIGNNEHSRSLTDVVIIFLFKTVDI